MWKNRFGYLVFTIAFAVFLFFFGRPYLIVVAAGLLLLAGLIGILLFRDRTKIFVEAQMQSGSREGKKTSLVLNVRKRGAVWAAGSVLLEVEFYHTMYGISERKKLLLPLTGQAFSYDMPVDTEYCGEFCIRCISAEICDLLKLFRVRLEAFREVRAMIYPHRVNLQAELSRDAIGSQKNEGLLQNRKGKDPREIFDLREYVPGDDVRSIHWKLSGKLDSLVVKEASDPAHYQIILMPDLGREQLEQPTAVGQLNKAVALCASIGEQLVRQGVAFHMAFPAGYELQLCEVHSSREFQDALSQWMSIELPEKSGMGLRHFTLEHMEQYFSKLLIFSSGKYLQELNQLDEKISITVISAVDGKEFTRVKLHNTCDVVEIPTESETKEIYHVIC